MGPIDCTCLLGVGVSDTASLLGPAPLLLVTSWPRASA